MRHSGAGSCSSCSSWPSPSPTSWPSRCAGRSSSDRGHGEVAAAARSIVAFARRRGRRRADRRSPTRQSHGPGAPRPRRVVRRAVARGGRWRGTAFCSTADRRWLADSDRLAGAVAVDPGHRAHRHAPAGVPRRPTAVAALADRRLGSRARDGATRRLLPLRVDRAGRASSVRRDNPLAAPSPIRSGPGSRRWRVGFVVLIASMVGGRRVDRVPLAARRPRRTPADRSGWRSPRVAVRGRADRQRRRRRVARAARRVGRRRRLPRRRSSSPSASPCCATGSTTST